jgi:hypothetical protein
VSTSDWFAVRCIFRLSGSADDGDAIYEERVTLWRAGDHDAAIRLAEAEAQGYATALDSDYIGLAQAYAMADEPAAGAEVFSLTRDSTLSDAEYLDMFFDTGKERQGNTSTDGP